MLSWLSPVPSLGLVFFSHKYLRALHVSRNLFGRSEQQQGTGRDKSGAKGEDRKPCRKGVGRKSWLGFLQKRRDETLPNRKPKLLMEAVGGD